VGLSVRNAQLAVLGAWAAFFAWLQATDQVLRYLGPRTAWVVPFGALTLTAATLGYARWSRGGAAARQTLSVVDALRLGAVLAPVVFGVCLSDATLGSLAAANKLGDRGVDFSRLAGSLAGGSKEVHFLTIRAAEEDPEAGRLSGLVPGRPVKLTGFVLREPSAPGATFRLARFYITCCVADTVAIDVPVEPVPGSPPARKDAWFEVSGVLERREGKFVIAGARVRKVPVPGRPYLLFKL
jgi:uncharacterized repeat protein (TIGR03943 family)